MYIPRVEIADNGEINRQTIIQQVILFGKRPQTTLEMLAAAIYGSRYIDVLAQAKIYKHLDDIFGYVDANSKADCQTALGRNSIRKRVRKYVDMLRLSIGDAIFLNRNQPILSVQPEKPDIHRFMLETTTSSMATIAEFEYMVFNNYRKFRYLGGTSFSAYVFQNILYSLNAKSTEELEDNDAWQAQFAILLHATDLDDRVARSAFYENVVRYHGLEYDTSFVPKYDVNALIPQQPMTTIANKLDLIQYRSGINPEYVKQIPLEYMPIFIVFPFIAGHYIKPNGRIVFLNLNIQCKKSARFTMNELCHANDLEYAVESAARHLTLDDAIYFAVYSETLEMQALALMVIRCMIGNSITISKYKIQLPTALNILSWTKMTCKAPTSILLPTPPSSSSWVPEDKVRRYVDIIADIARSCFSKWGAAMLCGSYNLPEYLLKSIYDRMRNDAEKYVFYTLVLQDYTYAQYSAARNRLQPEFGQEIVDMSRHEPSMKIYNNSTLSERLDDLTEPLIMPTDINDTIITTCPPYKCVDMFEFADEQLRLLVANKDPQLSDVQFANYIALAIA